MTEIAAAAAQSKRRRPEGAVLAAVAAGGAFGSAARWGLSLLDPSAAGGFPWATFVTNVVGCLAIGALMAVVSGPGGGPGAVGTRPGGTHRLLQPFLGTGVLGGFTTFSTYVDQTRDLLQSGPTAIAVAYCAGTLAVALPAVWLGEWCVRAARRRP